MEKSFQTAFGWFTDYVMLFYVDICDVLKGPWSCGWEDLVWVLNTLLIPSMVLRQAIQLFDFNFLICVMEVNTL